MTSRWLELAEAYVVWARAMWEERLALLREQNKMSKSRIEFHRHSRASLVQFLEGFVGGPVARHEDVESFKRISEGDVAAFKVIATDIVRMHFLRAMVYDSDFTPPELCTELVRGAVYTVDPSHNRSWIERIATVDPKRTATALLGFILNGTDFEVGGAANASYWFNCFAPRADVQEFVVVSLPIYLRRFVETDNLDLRRCLMRFSWNPGHYEPALRPLLARTVAIAADHPDDFIRQRYEYDTGQSQLIPCLPHRNLWTELGEDDPPAP